MARQSLESWIEEALNEGAERGEPAVLISLMHMVGTSPKELHSIKLSGQKKWTAKDLSAVFTHKTNSHAQDLPGPQTYDLWVFGPSTEGAPGTPYATHPFVVSPQPRPEGLMTEAPTAMGQTQQGMRHVEAMFQMSVRAMREASEIVVSTAQMLARENVSLRNENIESFTLLKELLTERSREEHAMRLAEIESKRKAETYNRLLAYAPALVNSIAGKDVFPAGTGDTAIVEALAEGLHSLPPEEVMKLAAHIPPHVVGPLMQRANEIIAKKAADAEKSKEIVRAYDGPNEVEPQS